MIGLAAAGHQVFRESFYIVLGSVSVPRGRLRGWNRWDGWRGGRHAYRGNRRSCFAMDRQLHDSILDRCLGLSVGVSAHSVAKPEAHTHPKWPQNKAMSPERFELSWTNSLSDANQPNPASRIVHTHLWQTRYEWPRRSSRPPQAPPLSRFSGFRLYQMARFSIVLCTEMQSVAVGWQVYEITHRPLDLGFTGLVQFLPGILLFLVAGHITDRFDRRKILTLCYVGFAISSALLLMVAFNQEALHRAGTVRPIFAILFLVGVIRCFSMPSSRALLPQHCSRR